MRSARAVLEVLHSERFLDDSPGPGLRHAPRRGQVPRLGAHDVPGPRRAGRERERRAQLRHPVYAVPELLATGPNQLWSWDITKLKGPVKWTSYSLYVLLDVFSRYVPGWLLAHHESGTLADRLIAETVDQGGRHRTA